MGTMARQCVRCGEWFIPGPSNDAGRKDAGLLLPEGPVCNPCLDAEGN